MQEAIIEEWRAEGHLTPGELPRGWRDDRLEYPIRLPASGWFVDIEAASSMTAVARALQGDLEAIGVRDVTVATLRGKDRAVTTRIAAWVRDQVLDDGSLPHGIWFGSKLGSEWRNWAIWLRAVDNDKPLTSEPTKAADGREIKDPEHNIPLRYALDVLDIKCW